MTKASGASAIPWGRDRRDILQDLLPKHLPQLGQFPSVDVVQFHRARNLPAENLVLGHEVLVPEESLFVDRSHHASQRPKQLHAASSPSDYPTRPY